MCIDQVRRVSSSFPLPFLSHPPSHILTWRSDFYDGAISSHCISLAAILCHHLCCTLLIVALPTVAFLIIRTPSSSVSMKMSCLDVNSCTLVEIEKEGRQDREMHGMRRSQTRPLTRMEVLAEVLLNRAGFPEEPATFWPKRSRLPLLPSVCSRFCLVPDRLSTRLFPANVAFCAIHPQHSFLHDSYSAALSSFKMGSC